MPPRSQLLCLPGALLSCPVGAFQNFLAIRAHVTPGVYPPAGGVVLGYLGFIGVLVGRVPCGWLCPFGFIQDLIYKIPTPKFSFWRPLRWVQICRAGVAGDPGAPFYHRRVGFGHPWFCKLLCPAGTLLGAFPLLAIKPNLWSTMGFWFLEQTFLVHSSS